MEHAYAPVLEAQVSGRRVERAWYRWKSAAISMNGTRTGFDLDRILERGWNGMSRC